MHSLTRPLAVLLVLGASLGTATTAEAGRSLGLEPSQAPTPPTTTVPTLSMDARRKAIAEGELPEMLIAMPYKSSGRHFATRWYDEEGNVYRSREAAMIVRAIEDPNVDHRLQWRQWFVLASPAGFGTPLLLAGDQLGLAVQQYNYHQAAAVRAASGDAAALVD